MKHWYGRYTLRSTPQRPMAVCATRFRYRSAFDHLQMRAIHAVSCCFGTCQCLTPSRSHLLSSPEHRVRHRQR
jgi:hypothetical protein